MPDPGVSWAQREIDYRSWGSMGAQGNKLETLGSMGAQVNKIQQLSDNRCVFTHVVSIMRCTVTYSCCFNNEMYGYLPMLVQ